VNQLTDFLAAVGVSNSWSSRPRAGPRIPVL